MLSWRSMLLRVCAMLLALATIAGFTLWRVDTMWRGTGAQVSSVIRHGYQWYSSQDQVFGAHWVNLQPSSKLRSTELVDGDLPSWGEPRVGPYEDRMRLGVLAIGWPSPWIAWTFESSNRKVLFPPFAEIDDADTSLPNACDVLRGERPGPPFTWKLIPSGFLITALVLSGIYGVLLEYWCARRRAQKNACHSAVTQQAAVEARPE